MCENVQPAAEMQNTSQCENSQNDTASNPFHSLSKEIRELIWRELWNDTSCVELYKNTAIQVFVKHGNKVDRSRTVQGLPQWLLTSKAILEEGLSVFLPYADWTVTRRWNRYVVKSGSNSLSEFPCRNTLAGLPAAKKISIEQKESQVCLQDALFGPIHRPLHSVVPLLSPDLKELDIKMRVKYHPEGRWAIQPLRAELIELHLDKLSVNVELYAESLSRNASSTRPVSYAAERDIYQNDVAPLLRAGMARLAGIWMDQNFLIHVDNMDKRCAWQDNGGIKITASTVGH